MSLAKANVAAGTPSVLAPTARPERIEVIDILRGFAIFGILLVNMETLGAPIYEFVEPATRWPSLVDQIATFAIRFFAENKFYSLFSLLFGLGLTIQMKRTEERGIRFVPLYIRRLLVLLVFGLLHAYLFWVGDILTIYGLLGFLLLLFRKAKPKTLLIWSVIVLLIPRLLYIGSAGLITLANNSPESAEIIAEQFAQQHASYSATSIQATQVYSQGTFIEQTAQRVQDNLAMYTMMPFFMPGIFAMLLLGLYVGKRGILQDIPGHLELIRRVMIWGLVLGIIGNLISVVAGEFSSRIEPSWIGALSDIGTGVGAPALCLFYAAAIILLVQNPIWLRRLRPLAAVGRLSLSNYLFQTAVCTTIFYSYGLGLYGKIGPALGAVLAVVIYLVQIPLSVLWVRYFRFGPFEWLWRSLTYGHWQPMRIRTERALSGN
ncbi:MAG: DUF418 domain-containing protein [Anaerolineae bacterium]|nr:DUF418 domain-containing protein [Anaerolineae bacterium]